MRMRWSSKAMWTRSQYSTSVCSAVIRTMPWSRAIPNWSGDEKATAMATSVPERPRHGRPGNDLKRRKVAIATPGATRAPHQNRRQRRAAQDVCRDVSPQLDLAVEERAQQRDLTREQRNTENEKPARRSDKAAEAPHELANSPSADRELEGRRGRHDCFSGAASGHAYRIVAKARPISSARR